MGFTTHPRGPRLAFFSWDMPEIRSAVSVDGTLNGFEALIRWNFVFAR